MASFQGEISLVNLETDYVFITNYTHYSSNYNGEVSFMSSAFNTMIWNPDAPEPISYQGETYLWQNVIETPVWASNWQEALFTDYRGEDGVWSQVIDKYNTSSLKADPTIKTRGQIFVKITGRHHYGGV